MKLLQDLRAYGADIEGAMRRFLDDENLYKECMGVFLGDEGFENLGKAIVEGENTKAFECAHTLKGVAGNMGLTPIYKIISEITEDLRSGETSRLNALYAEIIEQRNEIKAIYSAEN